MSTYQQAVSHYTRQITQTDLKKGYIRIFEFLSLLRSWMIHQCPKETISQIYQGMMDMSYFAIIPQSIKDSGLKIAIVYLHETSIIEVWLSGRNRTIQNQWFKLFESKSTRFLLLNQTKGVDAILSHPLQHQPDFNDLEESIRVMAPEIEEVIKEMKRYVKDILNESKPK
ncbi:MAG TPA: hypothetical protein DEA51_00140 [Erysipelotrichaceae bacterium]|nr:hypothetical protein [Erysipelotrichaceae bacterium]